MNNSESTPVVGVHVHAPKAVDQIFKVLFCPKCKKSRRVTVNIYEWYGPGATCDAKRRRWKNIIGPCGYRWNFER